MDGFPGNGRPRSKPEVRRYSLGELLPRSLVADGMVTMTYPIVDPDDDTRVVAAGLMLGFYQGTDLVGVPIRLELEASGFEHIRSMMDGATATILTRLTEVSAEEPTTESTTCRVCGTAVFGDLLELGLCKTHQGSG